MFEFSIKQCVIFYHKIICIKFLINFRKKNVKLRKLC